MSLGPPPEDPVRRFPLLRFDAPTDFDAALCIYRTCRSRGVTPRGLVDCMIASVAPRNRSSLLCHDRDLAQVADIRGLERARPRP